MTEVVSVADAKRRFSELIERVGRGERIVVARRGRPVLALVPPAQISEEEEQREKRGLIPHWGILEGVEGADEWYADVTRIHAAREEQEPRPMPFFDDL